MRGVIVAKLERRAAGPTIDYADESRRSTAVQATSADGDFPGQVTLENHAGTTLAEVLSGARVIVCAALLIGIVFLMIQEHPTTTTQGELTAIGSTITDRLCAILLAILIIAVLLVPLPRR